MTDSEPTMRELFDLSGKVAVVTGASKGIGKAIAAGMAELGATVVVSSRKQEAVDEVAAEFRERGWQASAMAANVGYVDQAHALVDETVARFGRIDIIVNNAATNPVFGAVVDTDEGAFDKIMAVNVKGPFEICKRAFPQLKASRGSVINISSIGGITPERGIGIYSSSKAALINLTKVFAREWGPYQIRANVICPGLIKTKFSRALWQNDPIKQMFLQNVPLGRIGLPHEVAGLAVFLASDAGAYCTGGVFMVDGGFTA
ncbi:MAG: glucose 1-dehydrogenase [Anaerolineae bacterium]|nr:glucose 1-dehydrogenase [Anaerolineae bacterium]